VKCVHHGVTFELFIPHTKVSQSLGVMIAFKGVKSIFDDLLRPEVEVQVDRADCEPLLELAEFALMS